MKKKKFVLIIYILLLIITISIGFIMGCQNNTYQEKELNKINKERTFDLIQIDKKIIKEHIEILSSEKYQGRRAGTKGEVEAALYLAQQLKKLGVKPLGIKNTYFQSFPLPETGLKMEGKRLVFYIKGKESKLMGDNVLGVIESVNNPEKYVLLSAHYDHLGIWNGKLYPGANDNASGVGAVLEIARVLAREKYKLPYSVIIAFWSGEEMGLIGSNYFINHPTINLEKIKLVINFDSIGTGSENNFIIWSGGSSGVINRLNNEWAKWEKCKFIQEDTYKNSSDHKPFTRVNIPAVTVLAQNWLEGNHSPLDDLFMVNYDKINFIAQKIANFLCSSDLEKVISLTEE